MRDEIDCLTVFNLQFQALHNCYVRLSCADRAHGEPVEKYLGALSSASGNLFSHPTHSNPIKSPILVILVIHIRPAVLGRENKKQAFSALLYSPKTTSYRLVLWIGGNVWKW